MTKPNKNKAFFLELYDSVERQLSNYCWALTGNPDEAKDLIQDTILVAFENFDKLRKPDSFLFFLCGISKRLFLRKFRKRKYEGELNEINITQCITDNSGEQNADVQILYKALTLLPIDQREALVMFEIMGFSLKEIQDHQGGTLSGVKSRVARAREKLIGMFSETQNDMYVKPSKTLML